MAMSLMQGGSVNVCRRALALFLQGVTASVDKIPNPAIKDTWQKLMRVRYSVSPCNCCNLHLVT